MQSPCPENGFPILLLPANLPKTKVVSQPAELSGSGPAVPSGIGGPPVVGAPSLPMEWKKPDHSGSIHDSYIRCFPARLWSHLQWQPNQRSMVSIGTIPPHQLSRAASSHTGSSNILKREIWHLDPLETGQFYSSCLHQQNGGQHHQSCLS